MSSIDDSQEGFEDLRRGLDQLKQNISSLAGEHQVSADDLFPAAFMNSCSLFASFAELCDAAGTTPSEFSDYPDDKWDKHIQAVTSYASWEEMKDAATEEWAARRLQP